MNRAKNNRYQETENRIKSSLLTLLEMNRVEKITIKQVCAGAGIHRSSFYLHFTDIYDVLVKIENEFSQKLLQIFMKYIDANGIDRALVQAIFEFVKENDFTGKTVIPFCTSASSSLGDSGENLAEMAGTGEWQEGKRFSSGAAEEEIRNWIGSLDLSAK